MKLPRLFRDRARTGPRRGSLTLDRLLERSALTRTGLMTIALLVGVWIAARIIGSRTLFLVVYGGALVVGASWWLGRKRPVLEAARSNLPSRIRQGQRFDVEITLTARRRVGAFLLEERLHPHLGRQRRIPLLNVTPAAPAVHRYSITGRLRGSYEVGPLTVVWTDPFGLTQRTVELIPAEEVLVHPSTEPVHDRPLTRQWEDPPVRPPVSKPWPSGFEFYGMRNYSPGDDLRRIVWSAVARTGSVMVREFEQGITDKVMIAIDTGDRVHSPGYPSDTFEAAVKAAASLGSRHLKDGFAVTVEANGSRLAAGLRGPAAEIALLDALARVQVERATLAEAIERLVGTTARDAHNIVITPHLDEASAARLKLLLDRGADVILVALVWEDSDPKTLQLASAIGCQVVQLRPQAPLASVFAEEVGAGRR
ncbi:MAG TPA: DUF58 domain-containing protein [Actinomycetota bacterium]|nr:DUF58 domain-containing protein [Actinomycetota bacterium]